MSERTRPIRIEELAELLGVSVRRVRMIPAAELPYVQLETRGIRLYQPADVEAYLVARTVRS